MHFILTIEVLEDIGRIKMEDDLLFIFHHSF